MYVDELEPPADPQDRETAGPGAIQHTAFHSVTLRAHVLQPCQHRLAVPRRVDVAAAGEDRPVAGVQQGVDGAGSVGGSDEERRETHPFQGVDVVGVNPRGGPLVLPALRIEGRGQGDPRTHQGREPATAGCSPPVRSMRIWPTTWLSRMPPNRSAPGPMAKRGTISAVWPVVV